MASCVNISAVKPDELPLSSDGARPRRGTRALGLCFQGCHCALTIVLLAVVIWLGVSVRNRRNDILFEIRVRPWRARRARRGARRAMGRPVATRHARSRRLHVASPSRADARARLGRRTRPSCSRRASRPCRATRRMAACSAAAARGSLPRTCSPAAACPTTASSQSATTSTSSVAPASAATLPGC